MLVIASEIPDWTDAGLCIAGVRTPVYGMLSHSVPAMLVLAITAGTLAAVIQQPHPVAVRSAVTAIALMVIFHAVADWLTGLKPTWPGGPMIGLNLYRWPVADFILEAAVVVLGWLLYRLTLPKTTRASRTSSLLLASLLLLQLAADVSFALVPGMKKC
jgi:chromate transport protein ChrA